MPSGTPMDGGVVLCTFSQSLIQNKKIVLGDWVVHVVEHM